jgi:hypothetical protein
MRIRIPVMYFNKSLPRERVYRAVAPSNAGYVGMFETRLSVCMCRGVLFGVRSEDELLPRERVYRAVATETYLSSLCPGKVFSEPLPLEMLCVFVSKQR